MGVRKGSAGAPIHFRVTLINPKGTFINNMGIRTTSTGAFINFTGTRKTSTGTRTSSTGAKKAPFCLFFAGAGAKNEFLTSKSRLPRGGIALLLRCIWIITRNLPKVGY